MKRDFTWYARDGVHVRSPLRFNGGSVNEEGRVEYERDWERRERRRQERKAKNEREQTEDKREVTVGTEGVTIEGAGMPTEPRFVSEAYFMDFTFEPGNSSSPAATRSKARASFASSTIRCVSSTMTTPRRRRGR